MAQLIFTMKNINKFRANVEDSIPEGVVLMQNFFFTFSRFECALKNTPKYLTGNTEAKPNWDVFANDISQKFNVNVNKKVKGAVDYIIGEPPRKQINIKGNLVWQESLVNTNATLTNKLSVYIRRVRNNLMHGGKFNGNYNPETRNFQLINSSLILLDYFLELDTDVKTNFLNNLK